MTPGPAMFFATIPATKYMPVPQQEPIPNEVKSIVVRHFCNGKGLLSIVMQTIYITILVPTVPAGY